MLFIYCRKEKRRNKKRKKKKRKKAVSVFSLSKAIKTMVIDHRIHDLPEFLCYLFIQVWRTWLFHFSFIPLSLIFHDLFVKSVEFPEASFEAYIPLAVNNMIIYLLRNQLNLFNFFWIQIVLTGFVTQTYFFLSCGLEVLFCFRNEFSRPSMFKTLDTSICSLHWIWFRCLRLFFFRIVVL